MQNIKLSERSQSKPSKVREIFGKVSDLNKARGQLGLNKIIDLSLGQPHVAVNPHMKSSVIRYLGKIENCNFDYSPVCGLMDTRQIISELFNYYYPQMHYKPTEVMCTNGANQGLFNAFSIFIDPKFDNKDTIVTFSPFFGHYRNQIENLGGELITIDTSDTQFIPSALRLEEILMSKRNIRAVLLNYPNNPTGVNLDKKILEQIAEVLSKFPTVAIILDEVYRDLAYDGYLSIIEVMPEFRERTIIINSASKGLMAAPDLRCGFVAAPESWINAMAISQLSVTASVSRLTQVALMDVVNTKIHGHSTSWEKRVCQEFKRNTLFMKEALENLGFTIAAEPQAGFFLLLNAKNLLGMEIPSQFYYEDEEKKSTEAVNLHELLGANKLVDDLALTTYFMHVAGVAMTPGCGFGLPPSCGFLRLSCALPIAELYKAINRISKSLQLLNGSRIEDVTKYVSKTATPTKESVAIIGVGSVGEWVLQNIITDIRRGLISNIDKIYLIGNNFKKLKAKYSDLTQALLVQQQYDSAVYHMDHSQEDLIEMLVPTNDYSILKNSKYIITAFSTPMGPHIKTREDLLRVNARIAKEVGCKVNEYARKDAVLINLSNPVDVITWVLMKSSGLPQSQVVGVSGNLDSTRLAEGVVKKAKCDYGSIDYKNLMVLGEHGQHMVPIFSKLNVKGESVLKTEQKQTIDALKEYTIFRGTKMMRNMNNVTPHIGPAGATVALLRVFLGQEKVNMLCCVWNPKYNAYIGSVAKLNENGVGEIEEQHLTAQEEEQLQRAAESIKNMFEKESSVDVETPSPRID